MEVTKGTMVTEHNTREGDMTAEEVTQCVLDISSWLSEKGGAAGETYNGAAAPAPSDISSMTDAIAPTPVPPRVQMQDETLSSALIDGRVQVPAVLSEILKAHDGKMPFYDFTGLSCAEIVAEVSSGKSSENWSDGIVPFAKNADGDLLVVDSEGVRTWSSGDGKGSVDSPSLAKYVEDYRNKMLSGKLEYDEDCGIMEIA